MKVPISPFVLFILLVACRSSDHEWRDLFNGKDLDGWKASENPETFSVVDGNIVAYGPRAHLFYDGPDSDFSNFELELEVMTHAGANSGVFVGTAFQDDGWPTKGFEVQINNSHTGRGDFVEYKKTGSLYGVRNVYKALAQDSTWFKLSIRVCDQRITIKVDDRITTVDYPLQADRPYASGTVALQGHDPDSKVLFRNIRIRTIPSGAAGGPSETSLAGGRISSYEAKNFPLADLDVVATDSTIAQLSSAIHASGINAGVITRSSQPLPAFCQDHPVWVGRKVTDVELDILAVRESLSDADYVLGRVDVSGWAPVSTPSEFIETYVRLSEEMLQSGLVDVWDDACLLPADFEGDATALWTSERVNRVLDAAKANDVAIEINCASKCPDIAFIRKAKALGCRFVCGNTGIGSETYDIDYFLDAIDSAALSPTDIYMPRFP